VQLQDEQLLLRRDGAAPEVRAEVVQPSETAALAGALETCSQDKSNSRLITCPNETAHHFPATNKFTKLLVRYIADAMM
jgi:hypothetical protein